MKGYVQKLLDKADIRINGKRPWDIKVHNPKLYSRVLTGGSLALGESYMDNWWDVKELDQLLFRLLDAKLNKKIITPRIVLHAIRSRIINLQSKSGSKKVAEVHYDLGNDFYAAMLGKRMQYTCAYWKDGDTLDSAQERKLDLICKKIMLKPGEKVLELGCGWGGFAKYAAEKYGCEVTAYNISKEQVKYAREITKGLPVNIVEADYRNAEGSYDKVVAIGICEHVGHKNYGKLIDVAHRCLKDQGIFLLHTIGRNRSTTHTDPWIEKYIFPNSMLPSMKQLTESYEGKFVMEDWHNFSTDYDKTLMEWYANFDKHWPKFKDKYGDRFYRMWKYYLLASAASFRVRNNQLWQIVLSKGGLSGGYKSIR
jgi:cyclopropane-fatty-acyl-phospholipid synthase